MVLSNKEWLDKMDDIISAIQNGGDIQVIEDMLSNMWISSVTYNVGDYVLYNNSIWKCLVQNSNIAPSEGTTWTRVNITSEISTLNSNLSSFNNIFKQYYNYYTITEVDQIIILQTIEGYRPISIFISGGDRVMPNISYCFRFDIGINNIEVQSDTSYIGNKIIISAIYAKSSIFD